MEIEFYVELVAFRHFHAVDEAVDDHFPGLGTGRATEPGIRQYTLLLFIARMRIFLWLFIDSVLCSCTGVIFPAEAAAFLIQHIPNRRFCYFAQDSALPEKQFSRRLVGHIAVFYKNNAHVMYVRTITISFFYSNYENDIFLLLMEKCYIVHNTKTTF